MSCLWISIRRCRGRKRGFCPPEQSDIRRQTLRVCLQTAGTNDGESEQVSDTGDNLGFRKMVETVGIQITHDSNVVYINYIRPAGSTGS